MSQFASTCHQAASSLSVFKNRLKTYLFRRCYETVWHSVTFGPFLVIISHPRTVVLAIVFYCLGHFKNVYDDDDAYPIRQYRKCHSDWPRTASTVANHTALFACRTPLCRSNTWSRPGQAYVCTPSYVAVSRTRNIGLLRHYIAQSVTWYKIHRCSRVELNR